MLISPISCLWVPSVLLHDIFSESFEILNSSAYGCFALGFRLC